MKELVKRYVRNCHFYRRFKTSRDKYFDLLNSLFISNRFWSDINMNFVINLFLSLNDLYNAILMIVCKLSKIHHYISCFSEDDETSTEKTSKMLLIHVWKLHDLSIIIIFDRESQFVILTWKSLCQSLRIKVKLSTVFSSKTNDLSKIINQKMKRYFRNYCDYQQSNWIEWLLMIEYALNAIISAFIEIFSFMINYDFESRMSFNSIKSS
jgi:hypothetical protein